LNGKGGALVDFNSKEWEEMDGDMFF